MSYKHVTFREFITKTFMSNSGVSSKRVCGFLGWFVCLVICLYCTFMVIQAPMIIDTLFICSSALLGIDSVTGIWKKPNHKEPEQNVDDEIK